jgi:hypothetical protein
MHHMGVLSAYRFPLLQTSFAPIAEQDAGASAADMQNNSSMRDRTMGAKHDFVQHGGPSGLQVWP